MTTPVSPSYAGYRFPAKMKRLTSAGQAQRFLFARDGINNLFPLRRHRVPAVLYRAVRIQAVQVYAEVTGVIAPA